MSIKFKPLPNSVPEGTADGDEFDLVCTFKLCGKEVCVVQMGDVKADQDKKESYRPDFKDMAPEPPAA